jgi:hypothetical protein
MRTREFDRRGHDAPYLFSDDAMEPDTFAEAPLAAPEELEQSATSSEDCSPDCLIDGDATARVPSREPVVPVEDVAPNRPNLSRDAVLSTSWRRNTSPVVAQKVGDHRTVN